MRAFWQDDRARRSNRVGMANSMNLILLGPSGVGKGTHATGMCARHRLKHLATGDLFRHNVQTRTALGLLARRHMEEDGLVPDEIVEAMLEEWADKLPATAGALFDGFPRTTDQAVFLEQLLQRLGRDLDAAIYFQVDDDEILARIAGREICRTCQAPYHRQARPPRNPGRCDHCGGELQRRPDDTPERSRARLSLFHRITGPLLERYARAGKLIIVSGTGTIIEVGTRLEAAIAAIAAGPSPFVTVADLVAGMLAPSAPPAGITVPLAEKGGLNFVLLGGPGSGKGTQAEQLSARLEIPHVATGDLFRDHLRQATDLGRLAKGFMDRGELVPDDVTDAMVEERLAREDARVGYVLDGYPRTLPQAEALTDIMARLQRQLAGVLYIRVSDEAIIDRLSGRLICRACQAPYHIRFKAPREAGKCDRCGGELYQRADDNPQTVRARLVTFHRQTEPLIDYYRRTGLLSEIDGEGDVSDVVGRSLSVVRRLIHQPAIIAQIDAAPLN